MPERTCPFPEHQGKPWAQVVEEDRPYALWLVGGEGPDSLSFEDYDEIMDLLEETEETS